MLTGRKSRRSVVLRAALLLTMVAGTLTVLSTVSTPASAGPFPNIMIKNRATGECLSRPEKPTNERLYVEPCSDSPRQRWDRTCADFYCFESRFVSFVDRKCMHGAGLEHMPFVGMYECSSIGSRDIWLHVPSAELDAFQLVSRFYYPQCLDQPGSPNVTLAPCTSSIRQFWSMVPA